MPVVALFISLAAFLAAPPVFPKAPLALFALFATASVPAVTPLGLILAFAVPPSIEKKPFKAFMAVKILPISTFSILITGLSTAMSPLPMEAFKLSNCRDKSLTWFAQPSDVLMKSPEDADS